MYPRGWTCPSCLLLFGDFWCKSQDFMLQGFACCLSPGLQLAPLKHTVWNPDLSQTLPYCSQQRNQTCTALPHVWLLIRLKLQPPKQAAGKRIFLSGLQELKTRLCIHSFPIHRGYTSKSLGSSEKGWTPTENSSNTTSTLHMHALSVP